MTRRITLTILFSVWAMLLAAGLTAYFATRSVLLDELDARLVARAASLPEVNNVAGGVPYPEDRYLVRSELGQVVRRANLVVPQQRPKVIAAQFARLADGESVRSVTVQFEPAEADATPNGRLTVVYSGPADSFQRVLSRLGSALGVFGVLGGLLAAAIAAAASRTALRPLNDVSDVIGQIDERQLSRRIDSDSLPDELKPIGRRLNDMLQRLEENFQQRRQFLADASHELRTPVAALVTTLEVNLARRSPDVPRLRQALENCLNDARLLRGLVERLTRQVRGELQENAAFEETNLTRLLRECTTVAEGLALATQVTVQTEVPDDLFIRTRPDTLRRVLLNLLSNAIAYNKPSGKVTVACEVRQEDVVISVRDTGVGIPPEHLPHVFSAFYRADPARATDEGHFGLGLYQVQGDVTALNGTCHIDSRVNAGTVVRVTLADCLVYPPVNGLTSPAALADPENYR
ncbi:MAG TPA: ATP-binding protein [Tepidisphaeraceae bacterium]|jgi:signal transduction histidine kinase